MATSRERSWRVAAAGLAAALLLGACGQTAPPEIGGGPPSPEETAPAPPVEEADPAAGDEAESQPPSDEPADAGEAGAAEQPEQPEPEDADADTADSEPTRDTAPAEAHETPDPPAPPERAVVVNEWTPFAAVSGITLHHPSSHVERVGFHEANHDGARQLEVLAGAIAPMTLESRGRATGSRSAADVVVHPEVEIRSPVTGTVLRAGTYVLYCDYSDDFVVIEPDARPGWEVKLLHIDGVRVSQDQRVEAGRTLLAPRPTPLPFESQVDKHTAEPSWPHVHIEVVDPSIPNESSGGSC